ncbi:uncharacterized protein LOC109835667 [Asparagus officinalis]|uniref:uncharacterized protein LOC109835667 n=1 Tax=Asparagus officinalis TaxID=4686 RepID=UPI00098E8529|nr:uncharacterized protein LOC109835667 [Asparagus officinalis]
MANMTSVSSIENQENDQLLLFDNPSSRQLGIQWEHHFEQRKPRTDDKVIQAHQLKMKPTKPFLGMASGKFLGFVVMANGIRLDPDEVKAIQELPPPRNLKELRGLQGRLAYIRRFINNLSRKCQSFSKLIKKGVSFM